MAKKTTPESGGPAGRKSFGIRLTPALVKKLKLLAVKKETQVNLLLEEAIHDLLKKYGED